MLGSSDCRDSDGLRPDRNRLLVLENLTSTYGPLSETDHFILLTPV